jgi:hypothetical protein
MPVISESESVQFVFRVKIALPVPVGLTGRLPVPLRLGVPVCHSDYYLVLLLRLGNRVVRVKITLPANLKLGVIL